MNQFRNQGEGFHLGPIGLPVSFRSGSAFGLATIFFNRNLYRKQHAEGNGEAAAESGSKVILGNSFCFNQRIKGSKDAKLGIGLHEALKNI